MTILELKKRIQNLDDKMPVKILINNRMVRSDGACFGCDRELSFNILAFNDEEKVNPKDDTCS